MVALPLLQDGSCPSQNSCLTQPSSVHATCPQSFKCGSCVAWSPREKNRFTRNSGQCLLDRSTTQFLDCNAPICPYYRPRAENPAALEWNKPGAVEKLAKVKEVRRQTTKMTREAPPPSPEALSFAAFRDHDPGVAAVGIPVLLGALQGAQPLPPLLERFRGGTARVKSPTEVREVPIEGLWARLALLRRTLGQLEDAVEASKLDLSTKEKSSKDLGGIAGSMTTFNLLFAKKDDTFGNK